MEMRQTNNFDGLRLLAAMFVIVSHEFHIFKLPEPMILGGHSLGNLGVLIFFSISGFLVANSWRADPNPMRFFTKRFLRIAPAYFVVEVILGLGLPFNGPLWTIPFEVRCYLVLALAASLLPRPALPMCLAFLVLRVLGMDLQFTHSFGMFFAFGVLIAEYRALLELRWLALFAVAGVLLSMQGLMVEALALIVPPITIYIGIRSWPILRSAGRFGDLSYGSYLFAWPVQFAIAQAFPDIGVMAGLLASVPIVLAIAWLSWRFVEAPALALKPARLPVVIGEAANDQTTLRYPVSAL